MPFPGDEAPQIEELTSAGELMQALVRSAKGVRTYLPNNPMRIRFTEDLLARMVSHLERYGELRLEVEQFTLSYRGTRVYENREARESLAWQLHADGIRSLTFSPGITAAELNSLLHVLATVNPDGEDDDIVTRLWEMSLPNIGWLLEEDFAEQDVGWDGSGQCQQEAISRLLSSSAGRTPPLGSDAGQLLVLTGEEATWLRRFGQFDLGRDALDRVIEILSAILAQHDPELFRDFAAIAGEVAVSLLCNGDLGRLIKLTGGLARLRQDAGRSEEERLLAGRALDGVLSERTMAELQKVADGDDPAGTDDLQKLLRTLGAPSIGGICELLGRVEKRRVRKAIVEVLVELGRDNPRLFAPYLADSRWYLVRNLVVVLSRLDSTESLEMIAGLVSHREERVRREVLALLQGAAVQKAQSYFLRFLRDQSEVLRMRALQMLIREKPPFALKAVVALATSDDFSAKGMAEQMAVMEVIGALGSEGEIPLFRQLLLKRLWFNRAMERNAVLLAVAGLSQMKSPAARELLLQGRKRRNAEITEIIDRAIAHFDQSTKS